MSNAIHKISIDVTLCCGYGICAQMCPEVYKLDSDGIVYIESDTVPDELLESATEGAACCPAQVIQIESV
ncbi:ferredoxin [Gammaproteobacteria bacterium LSUCC0057]|uniref:Ferredoxin n=1 Tax=Gammaproteobacteria bacterium LSUCC0057 TaxID=2559237 RepID=A0A4Y8UH82_9GAMM|nr:ferredoxin [Gammaproteobacteria bacterium LSUCC0057]